METNIKQEVGLDFTHNKMELIPDTDCEIVHEDGKWYVIRKAEKYPKTYKECCEALGVEEDLWFVYEDIDGNHINPSCISSYRISRLDLYHDLEKLLICRDAYWKIAGDWKPDWTDLSDKYCIVYLDGEAQVDNYRRSSRILSFPAEEMCNAFYENFKDMIEQCKELL